MAGTSGESDGSAGSVGNGGSSGAAGSLGGKGGNGGATCRTAPSYGDLGTYNTPSAWNVLKWFAPFGTGEPMHRVALELFGNLGVFKGGAVTTGIFELKGDDLNYRTCGICLLIDELVIPLEQSQRFMATGGLVSFTSVSGRLTGMITSATFQHVTIDLDTYVSTPHPDGCTSAISAIAFDVPISP